MNKIRFNLTGMVLHALLVIILILSGITTTQSCKKKSDSPLNNVMVSGIFHGDTIWTCDIIPAKISFGFDEMDDGTVNGGVRIMIFRHKGPFQNQVYRDVHYLSKWEETEDGYTLITGRCNFNGDLKPIAFSGTIKGNTTFHYIIAGEQFAAEGDAWWSGPYLKPGKKCTQINAVKTANS